MFKNRTNSAAVQLDCDPEGSVKPTGLADWFGLSKTGKGVKSEMCAHLEETRQMFRRRSLLLPLEGSAGFLFDRAKCFISK